MDSYNFGGNILMKADEEGAWDGAAFELIGYPFEEPTVYLDCNGEDYYSQPNFSWSDDSIVLARKDRVLFYTQSHFSELLVSDDDGNIVWVDGRSEPSASRWNGAYPGVTRSAVTYSTIEYDLSTLTKKKYKMVLDEETPFTNLDFDKIEKIVGNERLEKAKKSQVKSSKNNACTCDGPFAQSGDDLCVDKSGEYDVVKYNVFSF